MIAVRTSLSHQDFVSAFAIRHAVFVEEQGIPAELDRDGKDDYAQHALVLLDGEPAATGRVIVLESGEAVLARIAVRLEHRGAGLGRMVVEALHELAAGVGATSFRLHPHRHLQHFYERLGYRTVPGVEAVAGHELITMVREV